MLLFRPCEKGCFQATEQTRKCHIYTRINVYMMSVYYHIFVYGFMFCAFIDLYTYFLAWTLVRELGQESLGPRVGFASYVLRWLGWLR
jgi:hypothetical protein